MNIRERLEAAEDQFLLSISAGPSSMQSFDTSWEELKCEVVTASQASLLDDDILALAHTTAQRIILLADLFLEQQKHFDQLESLFSNISLMEPFQALPPPGAPAPTPAYIALSHHWLLKNLHNPYPSIQIRQQISSDAGCARRDIDNWFIDARKRIGWTSLRKSLFKNKRASIIDAATRFFVEGDPKRPLEPGVDTAFATIHAAASGLYSKKFGETSLATHLDEVVEDMTLHLEDAMRQTVDRRVKQADLVLPHLSHSFDAQVIQDERTYSAIAGHKRRRTSPTRDNLSVKRSRLNPSPSCTQASAPEISLLDQFPPDGNQLGTLMSTTPARGQKRRLSGSDASGPKRPCTLAAGPRVNAISNPFPMPSLSAEAAVDEWLKLAGTGPDVPDVSVDAPDTTEPLDIALFDFSTLLSPYTQTSSSEGSSNSTPVTPEHSLPITNIDLPPQTTEKVTIDSSFSDPHGQPFLPFNFNHDDFSLMNYATYVPTELPSQPSPLVAFSLLQPESTTSTSWDWLISDTSPIHTIQASSDIFSAGLPGLEFAIPT